MRAGAIGFHLAVQGLLQLNAGAHECSGGHGFDDTLKGDGRRARRDWNRDWSELAPLRATEEGRGVTGTVTEGRP